MIAKIDMERKRFPFVQANTGKNQLKTKEKCGKSNKFVPSKNSDRDYKCTYVH
jgi:hypothetical protein